MNEWNDWGLKSGLYNFKQIRGQKRKADMARIKVKLTDISVKFTELLGADLKSIFGYIVAAPEADHERFWGNNLISITAFREEDEYFLTVVDSCAEKGKHTNFTLSFKKPENWKNAIDLKPYCAQGDADAIIILADTFLREWPKCRKLRYSPSKGCWV